MTHLAAGIRTRRPLAFIRTPSGVALVAALALLAAALARGGEDGREGAGVVPTAGAARGVIDLGAPVASLDADDRFGHASALLADDPALGRREYAVAAPLSGELAPGAGRVFIIGMPGPGAADRAGGDVIWAQDAARLILAATEPGAGFGAAVLGLAGFEGHDALTLLVTAPWAQGGSDPVALGVGAALPVPAGELANVSGPRSRLGAGDADAVRGRVYVFSAADGALLRTLSGRRGDTFGVMAELTDDLDADGVADIVIGSLFRDDAFNVRLRRQVFSARTGALLVDQDDFESPIVRLAADLNGDGVVDADDLAILLTLMGDASAPGALRGDLNRDGVVDGLDLAILLEGWGSEADEDAPDMLASSCADWLAEWGPIPDYCNSGGEGPGGGGDGPGGVGGTGSGEPGGGGGGGGGDPPCNATIAIGGHGEYIILLNSTDNIVIEFVATGSPAGGTYEWTTNLGEIVGGNNHQSVFIAFSSPGLATIMVSYVDPSGCPAQDTIELPVLRIAIDVDTNRDGVIDAQDQAGKGAWTTDRGAIFNVNYDFDGNRLEPHPATGEMIRVPDAIAFDDDGLPFAEDVTIHNAADALDIAPMVIRASGPLPDGAQVRLWADSREQIQSVHVYKRIAPGETAIWGSLGDRMGGAPEPLAIDITQYVSETDDTIFGVEGMFFANDIRPETRFDGQLRFTLAVVDQGNTVIRTDSVAMRVAPWIMIPHTEPSVEVWVEDAGPDNQAVRDALNIAGQLRTVPKSAAISGTRWLQDHVEVGYYQRPGGPKTYCVLRMPYSQLPQQPAWPLNSLGAPGVGVFQIGRTFGAGSGDYGGNLEVTPPTPEHPLGRVLIGSTVSTGL